MEVILTAFLSLCAVVAGLVLILLFLSLLVPADHAAYADDRAYQEWLEANPDSVEARYLARKALEEEARRADDHSPPPTISSHASV